MHGMVPINDTCIDDKCIKYSNTDVIIPIKFTDNNGKYWIYVLSCTLSSYKVPIVLCLALQAIREAEFSLPSCGL